MLRARTLLALTAALALSGTAAASSTAADTAKAEVTRSSSLELDVLREVNALRAQRRLPALSLSSALSRSAAAHSRAMVTFGFFSHDSRNGSSFSGRIKRFYVPHAGVWTVGENLAMFGGSTPTAADIVTAWMGSPGHRANLLRPVFREAGLGVMFNPSAGGVFEGTSTWVITLDLGRR
jgi:uncharacterized protein YkwD